MSTDLMAPPLRLPNDGRIGAPSLADHLQSWAGGDASRTALVAVIGAIIDAAVPLADRLALGTLPGDPTAVVGTNESGDKQKALDVASHEHMLAALRAAPVREVVSEEAEEAIPIDADAPYDVAIDPIDGSDSIGIGAPLGLLFAVLPAGVARTGRNLAAGGYVSFGHTVDLAFSVGEGVVMATLDRGAGTFRITDTSIALKPDTGNVCYNASNVKHWSAGLQRYVADILAGKDGPRGRDYNMRWVAAAVSDAHRILRRGGIFVYPADRRPGYTEGKLRLLYEAFPIAFLIEQAGGRAIDGAADILDRTATSLHQSTPLIFGSRNEVDALQRTLTDTNG